MKKIFNLSVIMLLAVASAFLACDEDPTDALKDIIKEDKGYVPKIARFTLTPANTANPVVVPSGGNISFDLRYWSEGTIEDVEFWMVQGTTQTKIAELQYAAAFSKVTKTDSLIYTYTIPAMTSATTSQYRQE